MDRHTTAFGISTFSKVRENGQFADAGRLTLVVPCDAADRVIRSRHQ